MHRHTPDWYRQVHLTVDADLAEKRWTLASKISQTLTRNRIVNLLRLFLFRGRSTDFSLNFTEELVAIDPEFPVKGNDQELGLMAGLVIASTIEQPSAQSSAFAFGIRCSNFPKGRIQPIQPEISAECEAYLQAQANQLRPRDFVADGVQLTTYLAELAKNAETTDDESPSHDAESKFRLAVAAVIGDSHQRLAARMEQLAEETSLLWWVFNEYSDILQKPTRELKIEQYALVSAAEATKRTHILPSPPSIGPLLQRALGSCKAGKKQPTFAENLEAADSRWREGFLKTAKFSDCKDFVPICTGLEKMQEHGDAASAMTVLSKVCPGVPADISVTPVEVAQQFYIENAFLRSISQVTPD